MGLSMLHHYAKAKLPPLLCSVEIDSDVALCSATTFQMPAISETTFCSTAMHNLPVHPVMVVGDVGSHRLAMGLSRFNVEVIALAVSLGQPHHLGRKAWRANWEAISCTCCDHGSGIENVPGSLALGGFCFQSHWVLFCASGH